jgi:hypothetical protein
MTGVSLLNALFVLLVMLSIPVLVSQALFYKRLRQFRETTWRDLGEPAVLRNNTFRVGLSVSRFVWKRRYKDLDDSQLAKLGTTLTIFEMVWLAVFAAGWIVLFVK